MLFEHVYHRQSTILYHHEYHTNLLGFDMLVRAYIMIYVLELMMNLSNIQQSKYLIVDIFSKLTMASFAGALRLEKFIDVHFKR